ncbi:MAG: hypothetical protein ACREDU_08130, partial [Methylocella sp.]
RIVGQLVLPASGLKKTSKKTSVMHAGLFLPQIVKQAPKLESRILHFRCDPFRMTFDPKLAVAERGARRIGECDKDTLAFSRFASAVIAHHIGQNHRFCRPHAFQP